MTTSSDSVSQILGFLDKIASKITAVAPVVWHQMVVVTQMESVAKLILGGVLILLSIIIPTIGYKIMTGCESRSKRISRLEKTLKEMPQTTHEERSAYYDVEEKLRTAKRAEDEYEWAPVFIISLVFGGLLFIASMFQLMEIWNWIGAFAPEARLVHNIMVAIR